MHHEERKFMAGQPYCWRVIPEGHSVDVSHTFGVGGGGGVGPGGVGLGAGGLGEFFLG